MCVGRGGEGSTRENTEHTAGGGYTHENTHMAGGGGGGIHDDVSCRTKLT